MTVDRNSSSEVVNMVVVLLRHPLIQTVARSLDTEVLLLGVHHLVMLDRGFLMPTAIVGIDHGRLHQIMLFVATRDGVREGSDAVDRGLALVVRLHAGRDALAALKLIRLVLESTLHQRVCSSESAKHAAIVAINLRAVGCGEVLLWDLRRQPRDAGRSE